MSTVGISGPCDEGVVRGSASSTPCPGSVRLWILAATIAGSSLTFIDGTVVNVALPTLQRELDADVSGVQWVVESYALMLSALMLVGGSFGDRFGRARVFSSGVILFAVASAACGLAGTVWQLVAARAVQGIGAALLVPGSLAIISASFTGEDRGRAIGTWSGVSAVAAGIGPLIGGWLIDHISWRWIFFLNVPLAAAVVAITWWRVPESRDPEAGRRLDLLGAGCATLGLGALVYGLIELSSSSALSWLVLAGLIGGPALLVLFMVIEYRRGDAAMMPLSLFRSRIFAGTNLLTMFLYGGLGGLLFFFPFTLIQIHGYSASAAGAALSPFVLAMFLMSRWAGGLVDRIGPILPLTIGPAIAAGGFALFAVPDATPAGYWTSFFPAVIVMSVGMSVTVAPLTTTVMGAVDPHRAGLASGINNAVSRTAALLAVALFGVAMNAVFATSLDDRLARAHVAPRVREAVLMQRSRLAAIELPPDLDGDEARDVEAVVEESFVAGFRVVALLAAALALLGSASIWLTSRWHVSAAEARPARP